MVRLRRADITRLPSVKHARGNRKARLFKSRAFALSCGVGAPQRGRSSVVERQLPKLYVEGSIPFARSNYQVDITGFLFK